MCNETLRRVHCCRGRAINIKQPECEFVALGIQHAMRMRHIDICGLPRSTILFPHYLINCTIFEKSLLNTKYLFCFPLQHLSETFLIIRNTDRYMIKMYCSQYVKDPLFLSYFNETWILSKLFFFSGNPQIPNFMSNHPVGSEWFHASRRTDRHGEANSPFSQLCESAWKLLLEFVISLQLP
jgi:hypothetical protein